MPQLTRRRTEERLETWTISYDGVDVGKIVELPYQPHKPSRWQWACGFYPGADPHDRTVGQAASFDEARVAFEAAWRVYLARRRPEDFEAWRRDRQFHADKRAGRIAPANDGSIMLCACGETFDSHDPEQGDIHLRHIYLVQRAHLGGW